MSRMDTPVVTGQDWMRDVTRRLNSLERRSMPSAADLLGPGLAPLATQVANWSDEEALYNGVYSSAVGAVNSPDSTRAWIGWTLADTDGGGVQRVTHYAPFGTTLVNGWPGVTYSRVFITPDNSAPQFSAWEPENPAVQVVQSVDATVASTTPADLIGMTTTINVASLDQAFLVNVTLRTNHSGTSTASLLAEIVVGGTSMVTAALRTDTRSPMGFHYLATGLAPGATVFKVRASLSAAGDTYTILATDSLMSVTRVT